MSSNRCLKWILDGRASYSFKNISFFPFFIRQKKTYQFTKHCQNCSMMELQLFENDWFAWKFLWLNPFGVSNGWDVLFWGKHFTTSWIINLFGILNEIALNITYQIQFLSQQPTGWRCRGVRVPILALWRQRARRGIYTTGPRWGPWRARGAGGGSEYIKNKKKIV